MPGKKGKKKATRAGKAKKSHSSHNSGRQKKSSEVKKLNFTKEIAVIVIVVIVAIALAFIFYSGTKDSSLAEVNGVKIYPADISDVELTIPPQMKGTVTQDELLEQAINFEILRQEAEKKGITVTDKEVEENVNYSLQLAGVTREMLQDSLDQQKIGWDDMMRSYKKQLLSVKFLNKTIMENITVSESEIEGLYSSYGENISVPLEDARDELNKTIKTTKAQSMLQDWIEQKRAEYRIVRNN